MRLHEMRDLAPDTLSQNITDTRKEILDLRFQLAAHKLENTAKLRQARKRLARLLTVQAQKSNSKN